MAKKVSLQISIDEDIKKSVEKLYKNIGITFSDAITFFAMQSLQNQEIPFVVKVNSNKNLHNGFVNGGIGIAKGLFVAPSDIDENNDEILKMFGIA